MIQSITGVYSAAATPIEADGSPCLIYLPHIVVGCWLKGATALPC